MKIDFLAYSFLILLGFLVIGTVAYSESHIYYQLWYSAMWATLIIASVYIANKTNSKFLKTALSAFVGWMFSAFGFELIAIFSPDLVVNIDTPSATFIWYLLAFLGFLTMITILHGKRTHTGSGSNS